MRNFIGCAASLCVLLFAGVMLFAGAALAYPAITHPVEDTAGVLSPAEIEDLAARIQSHRAATSVQIAVLTVPSTNGEPISDYSIAVASAWGGGQHGVDNGILVTLAINDHRSRIEVGSGLEARVTDSYASQLLTGAQPSFRARQYGDGLRSIVGALIVATGGNAAALQSAGWHPAQQQQDDGWPLWVWVLIIIGAVVILVVVLSLADSGGNSYNGRWSGGGGGSTYVYYDSSSGGSSSSGGGSSSWGSSGSDSSGSSNDSGSGGGGDFGGGGSDGGW